MTEHTDGLTDSAGPLERLLVAVGTIPMAAEPYLPTAVRRNFGVRIFLLAAISIFLAPGTAVVLFSDVLTAALFIGSVIAVTGFLGYCEMYRALREINHRVSQVEAGQFEIDFGVNRVNEIGETYSGLERTATSLGETIAEAETARSEAETAREEAEQAKEQAEHEREQARELNDHLEERATAYSTRMERAAEGDFTQRMDPESLNSAMTEIAETFNEMMDDLEDTVARIRRFADEVAEASEEVTTGNEESKSASE